METEVLWIPTKKFLIDMKTLFNAYNRLFTSLLKRLESAHKWQRVVKSSRAAMGYLIRIPYVLLGRNSRTWVLALFHFARFVRNFYRRGSPKSLAIYLKACQILLMKHLAGEKVNPRDFGAAVSCRNGIPSVIPKDHRKMIRLLDPSYIRFWMTLFGLFRVIPFKSKMKISTITNPGVDFNILPFHAFLSVFWIRSHINNVAIDSENLVRKVWLIFKSAPGSSSSTKYGGFDVPHPNSSSLISVHAKALMDSPLKNCYLLLGKILHPSMAYFIEQMSRYVPSIKFNGGAWPLGKLGVKLEPGKVRVFAMVDWWTQIMLYPLHRHIQGILKEIPQDATFDQDKAVDYAISLAKKHSYVASLDLTAATDRLPLILQSVIVNSLIPGFGQLWGELLVHRDYWLPGYRKSVRYSVGQPMGALSSWVMLALTHHFIVQYAAAQSGWVKWFPNYVILGDDIVIFDKDVTTKYLQVMEELGVPINLNKSLISGNGTFEFAKRFICCTQDCSPLSFKELDVSMVSLDALLLLVKKFQRNLRLSTLVRILGFGYRSLGALTMRISKMSLRLRSLVVWVTKPLNSVWSFQTYTEWLSMKTISSSSISRLHIKGVWDALLDRINKIAPWGLHWAERQNMSFQVAVPKITWAKQSYDEDFSENQVYFTEVFSALMNEYSSSLEESITRHNLFFKGKRPGRGYDTDAPKGASPENLDKSLAFLERWYELKSSVPTADIDLTVRLDSSGLRKQAGRWLRLHSLYSRLR